MPSKTLVLTASLFAAIAAATAPASAAPAGASPKVVPVRVTGGGVRPTRITLKTGEPVVLEISGDGKMRSLRIEALGVRTVVPPEQAVRLPLTPDHAGTFVVDCDVQCDGKATPASLVVAD
jgi:cytochrome c oxidase subunit 2